MAVLRDSHTRLLEVTDSTLCWRAGTMVIKKSCTYGWLIRFLKHTLRISVKVAIRGMKSSTFTVLITYMWSDGQDVMWILKEFEFEFASHQTSTHA